MQREKLQNANRMDIVNRLILFMEKHGIGSTQFADACGIPRPTLSQNLSGRNKKISDAVISKIHNAYPRLSVLWLLFGEGQMESLPNNQVPEPQKSAQYTSSISQNNPYQPPQTDNVDPDDGLFGLNNSSEPLIFDDDEHMKEVSSTQESSGETPTVTIPADGSKSIINIMVFYSDNSFQSFIPR